MHMQSSYRMTLSVLVAVALFCAVAPVWAQTPVAARTNDASADATDGAAGRPQIQFTSMEHDFGQAISGADLSTTFTFKNIGDAVLVIEKVKGG